jgi:hypothetical protein
MQADAAWGSGFSLVEEGLMFKCNRVFVKLVMRILLVGALGSVALAALPAKGHADVDKKFDWKNKKRSRPPSIYGRRSS